ncbi:uncharacterized protein DSM5745_00723 [Aspergillus mulundensis]|uniref:Uncharacterized protein n=1 Tax=Aspergillus mulundensis TaxID=1810919 RepID=A0A3D8T4L1_9EURO|nr:hypothetical protein DSM5745_00723 [Aspergillus mulundensis]RDW93401.1 hypothetical protein DSM5745_00723 [Aspergillus mulundensis]
MRRFLLGGSWNSRDRSPSPPPPQTPIGRRVPIQLAILTAPNTEVSSTGAYKWTLLIGPHAPSTVLAPFYTITHIYSAAAPGAAGGTVYSRVDETANISWEDFDRMVAQSGGYEVVCELPHGKMDARLSGWIDRAIEEGQIEKRWVSYLLQALWRRDWIKRSDVGRVKEKVPVSPWEVGRK